MEHPNFLKRTNKYVYLSNGTYMSHSDYHQYKQGITNEMAIVHAKEFRDSIHVIVVSKKQLDELRNIESNLEEKIWEAENQLQFLNQQLNSEKTDWEKMFRNAVQEKDAAQEKIIKIAQKVYLNFEELPVLKDFKFSTGIKFILQENEDGNICRFRFDPYQMVANFHSSLSQVHQAQSLYTVSGGWIMFVDNRIILYNKSGDYGSYNSDKAIAAAQNIFPDRIITSHPDASWDLIKHLYETKSVL